jgi:hypothetical protein
MPVLTTSSTLSTKLLFQIHLLYVIKSTDMWHTPGIVNNSWIWIYGWPHQSCTMSNVVQGGTLVNLPGIEWIVFHFICAQLELLLIIVFSWDSKFCIPWQCTALFHIPVTSHKSRLYPIKSGQNCLPIVHQFLTRYGHSMTCASSKYGLPCRLSLKMVNICNFQLESINLKIFH